jgi:hypothetical protein
MDRYYSIIKRFLKRSKPETNAGMPCPVNPSQEDIYLVEFPKSGVTYLGFLLGNIELLLEGRNNEYISLFNYSQYIPDVHFIGRMPIRRWAKRTFIKSHERFTPFYLHVIYLIRHPEDVMVSYYNYMRDEGLQLSFHNFILSPIYGVQAWCEHVHSWMNVSNALRVHFMRYEDLVHQPFEVLSVLYKNLGVNVPSEVLEQAIERSHIDKMKESEELYRRYHPNYRMNFVGKQNKISKAELFQQNPDAQTIIQEKAQAILKRFYAD